MGSRNARAVAVITALVASTVIAACAGVATDDVSVGTTVRVLAVWKGTEQQHFARVLADFTRATGVRAKYVSTGDTDIASVIDRLARAGRLPDVAILPHPALLQRYAADGTIHPLDAFLGDDVRARYDPTWVRLGSWHSRIYGVWVKAAHKSLVWYRIGTFERLGLVPPDDLDGFGAAVDALRAAGVTPFAVAAEREEGWVLTDWFENLYVRLAGARRYDELAAHRLPWTDPSVRQALAAFTRFLDGANLDGGVLGALRMTFPRSAARVLDPGKHVPAMVVEGDFVPGVVERPAAIGVATDAFVFPGTTPNSRAIIGGGDVAVLVRDTPGGRSLLRFLASGRAGETWARLGGYVSPNNDVNLSAYPDVTTRRIARSVLDAGSEFRFDLSDLQPVEFGSTPGRGMYAALRRLLVDHDVDAAARRLEAAATAAYAP